MKDQDPNQERQVATQDPTQSREQAQAEQQYQHDQQPRPEFQSVEQRQPSQPVEPQSRQQANGGLIGGQEMDCYAARWVAIQAAFVDEPKKAVEQADKLVEEARRSFDIANRKSLYSQFQALFLLDMPSIPLYVPIDTYFVSSKVSGVDPSVLFSPASRFRNVYQWTIAIPPALGGN